MRDPKKPDPFMLTSGFLLLALSVANAGDMGKLKARSTDLVNTQVRNLAVQASMKAMPKPMVDPAIDDGPVFSYFARPSFQLGFRGGPLATQVTDNGHLWTGAAEWLLLVGDPLQPVNQRIYTLEKGYLPCITYTVRQGEIVYTVRAFQFPLNDSAGAKPVNFIRVTAENLGGRPAMARFAAGLMYGPRDHRCQQMKLMEFNPQWTYAMTEKASLREGKILQVWRVAPSSRLAGVGLPYSAPFRGVGREEPAGLAAYQKELGPNEKFTAEFAVPHYPADPSQEAVLSAADFSERRAALEKYWDGWLAQGARFEVGESKVNNAVRANIIHALMSQNIISEQEVEQHVNRFQYNRFWLRDSSFFVSMYEKWGYPEVAKALCRHFFRYQRPDGNFVSQKGQFDGWGQTMWAFGTHVHYTDDYEFAQEALPYVERAVAWLKKARAKDKWGLMPPTDAFDNEQIAGRYTGHNFWALAGLESVIALCNLLDREDLVQDYENYWREYRDHFLALLRQVAQKNQGIIPPGMDVPGGIDWGNLLAVYPLVILDPHDPLVTRTFEHYRKEHMAEGIATYGLSMHHYLTERVAQTALVRGEQELALRDFYAMLLHTGACHEGFEWTVFPWDGRDYCLNLPGAAQTCNFPPHGWYAANLNLLFRNLLVREEGQVLHLASALSPAWTQPGQRIVVERAPTPFALISYTLQFTETGARLSLDPPGWCSCSIPEKVIFHVPYYVKLKSVSASGKPVPFSDSEVELFQTKTINYEGPTVIDFTWERLPVPPLSYEETVRQYRTEYRRRWEESRSPTR